MNGILPWNERRWLYAAGVLLLVMLAGSLRGSRSDAAVEQALESHERETVRDTARIRQAVAVAEVAARHQQDLVNRARSEETLAGSRGDDADSLRGAVSEATAPRDSLAAWERAYDARVLEVHVLETVAATRDSALMWASVRADSLHVALAVSERRAERADSVIRLVVGGCRVARFIPCPSRRTVGVVTALTTAVVVGALTLRH